MEELQKGGTMNTIGPIYPAHIVVSEAEVKLVADETTNANTTTIKSDQQQVEAAQEVEAAEAKSSRVDFVT
jgi:hypothetical protein